MPPRRTIMECEAQETGRWRKAKILTSRKMRVRRSTSATGWWMPRNMNHPPLQENSRAIIIHTFNIIPITIVRHRLVDMVMIWTRGNIKLNFESLRWIRWKIAKIRATEDLMTDEVTTMIVDTIGTLFHLQTNTLVIYPTTTLTMTQASGREHIPKVVASE